VLLYCFFFYKNMPSVPKPGNGNGLGLPVVDPCMYNQWVWKIKIIGKAWMVTIIL